MAYVSGIKDKQIITKSFRMVSQGISNDEVIQKLDWDKYFNVFSSSIGDNRYINPLNQFSPATDPRYGRFLTDRQGGMGSMYKEVFEDNVTLLTLTPGVPQFSGMLNFITNMFDPTAAIMANKGRAPSAAFYIGQAAGAIAFWPFQLLSVSMQFLNFLANNPKNKFYTIKPTTGAYIMAANGVLNDLMNRLGYIDPVLPTNKQEQTDPLYGLKPEPQSSASLTDLQALFPNCINTDGTIDLMRLVMRGTRKHRFMIKRLAEIDNDRSINSADEKLATLSKLAEQVSFDQSIEHGQPSQDYVVQEMETVGAYRDQEGNFVEGDSAYLNKSAYSAADNRSTGQIVTAGTTGTNPADSSTQTQTSSGDSPSSNTMQTANGYGTGGSVPDASNYVQPPEPITPMGASTGGTGTGGDSYYYVDNPNDQSWLGNISDLVETALAGGLDAFTFRVEPGGSVSDTFSNNATASPLAQKFNGMVQQANNFKFDIQGGQTGIGAIDTLVNGVKDVASGFMSGSVIGNIPLALMNNSYVKIPDHWESSSVNLHKESFEIHSRCTYAHPYEQITKIWMLIAMVLPMVAGFSTGGSSYSSPFLVKVFSKSKCIIRTGMVESATFTLGEGPAGWTKDRKPLNLKITLNFVDLDPFVTVPLNRGFQILDLTNPAAVTKAILNDDGAYSDYLNRLTGMDYLDTVLKYSVINRNLTKIWTDTKMSFRAENIAAKLSDSIISDAAQLFYNKISR